MRRRRGTSRRCWGRHAGAVCCRNDAGRAGAGRVRRRRFAAGEGAAAAVAGKPYDWSGFYAGAHFGYAAGSSRWSATSTGAAAPALNGSLDLFNGYDMFKGTGSYFVGFQGGYNYLLPSRLLLGVEADIVVSQHARRHGDVLVAGDRHGELRRTGGNVRHVARPHRLRAKSWDRQLVVLRHRRLGLELTTSSPAPRSPACRSAARRRPARWKICSWCRASAAPPASASSSG